MSPTFEPIDGLPPFVLLLTTDRGWRVVAVVHRSDPDCECETCQKLEAGMLGISRSFKCRVLASIAVCGDVTVEEVVGQMDAEMPPLVPAIINLLDQKSVETFNAYIAVCNASVATKH